MMIRLSLSPASSAHSRSAFLATLIALAGCITATTVRAQDASLEVTLDGLRNTNGKVVVCIWKEGQADFPKCNNAAKPVARQMASAKTPSVVFAGVAPGTYAVTAMHDETGTGDGEFNLVGLPKSGVALSNNPTVGMTNRPTFEKAKFAFPTTRKMTLKTLYLF